MTNTLSSLTFDELTQLSQEAGTLQLWLAAREFAAAYIGPAARQIALEVARVDNGRELRSVQGLAADGVPVDPDLTLLHWAELDREVGPLAEWKPREIDEHLLDLARQASLIPEGSCLFNLDRQPVTPLLARLRVAPATPLDDTREVTRPSDQQLAEQFFRRVPGNMDDGYADQHQVERIKQALTHAGPDVVWHGPDGRQVEVAVLGYSGPAGPGGIGLERGEPGAYLWVDGFDLPLALADLSEREPVTGDRCVNVLLFNPDGDDALAEMFYGPDFTEMRLHTVAAPVPGPEGWVARWGRQTAGLAPLTLSYLAAVSDECVDDVVLFEIAHRLASHDAARAALVEAVRQWRQTPAGLAAGPTLHWGVVAQHLDEITVPGVHSVCLIEREQLDVTTFENDPMGDEDQG